MPSSPPPDEEPARKGRRTRWSQSASEAAAAATEVKNAEVSTTAEPPPSKSSAVMNKAASTKAALEKARKAVALQRQIQDQIAAIKSGFVSGGRRTNAVITAGVAAALRTMPQAKPVRFDRLGRELDAEGKLIDVKPLARSTLKVNINKEREAKLKQVAYQTKIDRNLYNPSANPWFDPALPTPAKGKKRGLSFVERGFYTKKEKFMHAREQAQQMGLNLLTPAAKEEQRRREAANEAALRRIMKKFKPEDESTEEEEEEEENPNLIKLGTRMKTAPSPRSEADVEENDDEVTEKAHDDYVVYRQEALHLLQRKQVGLIPDVEWWDQPLLRKLVPEDEGYNPEFPYEISDEIITDLVEHPIPIPPVVDGNIPLPPVLHLTPKERAKLRRRKRQDKEKEKRDKIRMGLMAPPPPKVKLANLSRVLGTVAAAGPSQIEADVRGQVAARLRMHEERNEARKLDPEQRRKRTILKWTKMPSEAEVPTGGAEVDRNAQQFHVTGGVLLCPPIGNLVIAEGSHKALKGYKKLMLRRIKWSVGTEGETAVAAADPNFCLLLWEGVVKDRAFKQWKVYPCKAESEVRKILSDRNTEHYWEMLKKTRYGGSYMA